MQRNETRLLRFAIEYPGWHTCGRDAVPTMRRLAARGLIEVADYGRKALPQFRVALPEWAHAGIDTARSGDPVRVHTGGRSPAHAV